MLTSRVAPPITPLRSSYKSLIPIKIRRMPLLRSGQAHRKCRKISTKSRNSNGVKKREEDILVSRSGPNPSRQSRKENGKEKRVNRK